MRPAKEEKPLSLWDQPALERRDLPTDLPELLLPARRCLTCGRTFERIGGNRLTATKLQAVLIRDDPDGGRYLELRGTQLNDRHLRRAEKLLAHRRHPWFCQLCARKALCELCGSPLRFAPGSDAVDEAGHIRHHALLGFTPRCSNAVCKRHG